MRLLGLLVIAVAALFHRSQADYIGAVVEYAPRNSSTPNETLLANLQEYLHYINQARQSGVQIIVFPEYGLTGLIDDPTNYSVEVPEVGSSTYNTEILQGLANAAAENLMYIVINIAEKARDAQNKTIYYNTNVVFDKERRVAAKYRKINLYEEDQFTPGRPEENRNVTFVTDFGITFGTFICFDIVFYTPSRTVLNSGERITNIVYPTAWYANLPFYHSLSFHYGYAVENGVNFLVSNINNVREGQGGSGIYGADGTIYSYYLSGLTSSRLLISNVKTGNLLKAIPTPGDPNVNTDVGSELSNFITTRLFENTKYQMRKIDVSVASNTSENICDGEFCCTFSYNVSTPSSSAVYYLMAYRGPSRLSPSVMGQIKACYILACETNDASTCGSRNVTNTVRFDLLSVSSEVPEAAETYYMPYTMTTELKPVFNSTYSGRVVNSTRHMSLRTLTPAEGVLTFGLYTNSSTSLSVTGIVLVMALLFKYLVV